MARKKKAQEHENHERWLVSYADFITLLFAFFVVMYSISSVNEGKYRILSETLESVFTEPTRSLEPIQVGEISYSEGSKTAAPAEPDMPDYQIDVPDITRNAEISEDTIRTINDISQQLNAALSDMIDREDVSIKQGDDWLELEIKSNVLFHSGEARLARDAIPVIGQVADILGTSANPIQVEGFTDNQPINTPRFPSNWELSAARAASVVHLLDRYGIEPDRMSAIGYGEYKPIADNATEDGRQKNRRVVLVVLGSEDSRRSIEVFDSNKNTSTNSAPITPATPTITPISPVIQNPVGPTP